MTLDPRSPEVVRPECSLSQPAFLSPGGTLKHPKSTFESLTCLNILTMSVLLFSGQCCVQEHPQFGCQLYMLLLLV